MGAFFLFIFSMYIFVTFAIWPYMWAKRTNRSQAPFDRRLMALGYAASWPAIAVRYFQRRNSGVASGAVPPGSASVSRSAVASPAARPVSRSSAANAPAGTDDPYNANGASRP